MLNENARAKSDNDLISVSLEFFFERYEVLIKIMESGLFTLLGAAIGNYRQYYRKLFWRAT